MTHAQPSEKKSYYQQFLRFADDLRSKDWGSPERNFFAADLSRSLILTVHQNDTAAMEKLRSKIRWFNSPIFLLGERIGVLVSRHENRIWKNEADTKTWQGYISRAKIAYQKRDTIDLKELGKKIASFLRRQNEHKLAQPLEDAWKK